MGKIRIAQLSTKDNPFNPFDQFEEWYAFDSLRGYGTAEYVARIAKTSEFMSEKEFYEEIERAIDEIIEINNPEKEEGFYVKIVGYQESEYN